MSSEDVTPMDPNSELEDEVGAPPPLSIDDEISPDDLLPSFAIGATDPEDTEIVKAHLAEWPESAAQLAEYLALHRALLHGAGYRTPSPGLADKIRAAIEDDSTISEAAGSAMTDMPSRRHLFPVRWSWYQIAATFLIIALLVSNAASILHVYELREQHRQLSEQLQRHNEVLAVMVNSGVQETILPAAVEDSDAQATVRWLLDRPVAILFADRFPVLGPDQVYQLWLVRDGERSSGGLFTVNDDGFGALVIETDAPLSVYERMGITPEPAGGSPGPTGSAVVRGPL